MKNISLVIADGNEIYLEGLQTILRRYNHIDIANTYTHGGQILSEALQPKINLIILSSYLQDVDGIEIAAALHKKYPNKHILILSNQTSEVNLDRFLECGAIGLMLNSTPTNEILNAIQKVAGGERYLGKHFSKLITKEYMRLAKQKHPKDKNSRITRREKEILGLLTEGLTSAEIANRLYISPRTVDTHRTNLLHKLNLKNTAALVRYAIENKYAAPA
jgi:DNA-binding NarL/FixJ family response regulator